MFIVKIKYYNEETNNDDVQMMAVPGDQIANCYHAINDTYGDNVLEVNIRNINYDNNANFVYLPNDHDFLTAFEKENDY